MGPWGRDTFHTLSSLTLLTPKTNKHRKLVEGLKDYPFLPWEEAPGSLRPNLAHPNFANFSLSIQT